MFLALQIATLASIYPRRVPTKNPNEINGLAHRVGWGLSAWADTIGLGIGKANEIKGCAASAIADTANSVG
nr:hypothetical protein [Rhodoferax sp.]